MTPNRTPWTFDPHRLAAHECDAWVGYYRRDWRLVLSAAVGMVRAGFGLPWPAAVRGAWYVLRANQAWAPYPDNDPQRARMLMSRFYALVARSHALTFDPDEAARLEVDWWREHRILQRERTADDETPLVAALARLYAYVYRVEVQVVTEAAHHRAVAMRISDAMGRRRVRPGRSPDRAGAGGTPALVLQPEEGRHRTRRPGDGVRGTAPTGPTDGISRSG